ncbi:MAG: hypothetical protein KDB24_02570 [Microthrixaceae bacterium]|nr:hypothetical protein [Microthrixaceae bacterium]
MALTEASRNVLYTRFLELVDDEKAVSELLSYYPARDIDEPATRDLVMTTSAELRAEMADLRAEIAELRAELKGDIADLRSEFKGDIAELRSEMDRKLQSNFRWTITTMIALITPLYAILIAQLIVG